MTLIDEINGAKITLRELQCAVAQQQAAGSYQRVGIFQI